MIPGAGLYLPEAPSKPHEYTGSHNAKKKSFEYRSSQDSDPDHKSVTLSRKSSEDVTRVSPSLSTVFDFAEWASAQGKVSSENEVFVNLLQRVRRDVTEASRLYTSSHAVKDYLEAWPDKKTWIETILHDIQRALNDIGLFMETVRVSGDDGGAVGLRRKFDWVMSHHKKLMSKQQYLMLCHQSLMAAVQVMQTAEMNATFDPIYEMPAQPWESALEAKTEDESQELISTKYHSLRARN
ncbi:hypothetical protein N0V90_008974 [Kalmusia sp. IMI 367209]|nr:hypothetical protein N0V90_008974 [Kalmusia sp. IMI 367209]